MHEIEIKNCVGEMISVHDATTDMALFTIEAGRTHPYHCDNLEEGIDVRSRGVYSGAGSSLRAKADSVARSGLIRSVNIHFKGFIGNNRKPLLHLPFNSKNTYIHLLQPLSERGITEEEILPVVEEVLSDI